MHFNLSSPLWQFVDTCVRFSLLNLLFLLTLIPIVTIGPARAALYSTLYAYNSHEDINLGKEYLKRFRKEFLSAIGMSVIITTAAAATFFALAFWNSLDSNTAYIGTPVLLLAGMVILLTFEMYYPLQARYANTFIRTLRNTLMLPWYSFGCTLALLSIDIIAIAVFVYAPWSRFIFVLLGCAWVAYVKSLIYLRLFNQIGDAAKTSHATS